MFFNDFPLILRKLQENLINSLNTLNRQNLQTKSTLDVHDWSKIFGRNVVCPKVKKITL